MKTFLLLSFFIVYSFVGVAQQTFPTSNLLLGYQEFPTVVQGHASDVTGNQYFAGHFKGQLTVNKHVITQGNGLEDIFWVKTNADGQVLRYKKFGSGNSEITYPDAMAMSTNGSMLMGMRILETVQLDGISVQPYISPVSGVGFATCVVAIDTSGNVKWAKKMNLQSFRIVYNTGVFHVIGSVMNNSSAIKVEDQIVIDTVPSSTIIHLMFSENGQFLGAKKIATRKAGQLLTLNSINCFSDGQLLYSLRISGDTAFSVNNVNVPLPSSHWGYYILIKTDTSYNRYRVKVLNQPGQGMEPGGGNFTFPVTISKKDSVYLAFYTRGDMPAVTIDGYIHPQEYNALYVLDSFLQARRQVVLGSSRAGYYAAHTGKRRISFRNLLVHNDQFYFVGQVTGINESPINAIQKKDTLITILPGTQVVFDQNGLSKSFIAKCDLGVTSSSFKWYGDHSEFENMILTNTFTHDAGQGQFCFANAGDNLWNPWLFDTQLNIITGSMKKNTDQPETAQMIKYFSDGSRLVIGYARGKTAMDSANSNYTSNYLRRDAFIARVGQNNQVIWSRRLHSTLLASDIRGLEMRNNKAWFLINYVSSANDSNYIRVGSDLYPVKASGSIMANIDTAGVMKVFNLSDPILRGYTLRHFSFFNNGDLAVATSIESVPYPGFVSGSGIYLFRLDQMSGSVTSVRKFTGIGLPSVISMKIDPGNNIYLSTLTGYSQPYTLSLYAGNTFVDSIRVNAASTNAVSLFKLQWDRFYWQKRFSNYTVSPPNNFAASPATKHTGEFLLVQNKPLFIVPFVNQSLNWDGQTVTTGTAGPGISMISLDENGGFVRSKVLKNLALNYARKGEKEQVFLSCTAPIAVQVDTISIGNAGFSDGVGLVIDADLIARKSIRIGSAYSEGLSDMDIFQDSLVALAYSAQTNPQVYFNRTSVAAGDYEEDAYLGSLVLGTNITTGINTPMPFSHSVVVAPNPISNRMLQFTANVTEVVRSSFAVYHLSGQFISGTTFNLIPTTTSYSFSLPSTISKGVYYLIISNKKWTATRTFVVL